MPAFITVVNNDDSITPMPAGSLREALTNAKDGDIIDFKGSVFFNGSDPIVLTADLPLISKNITITGFPENERVMIDGFEAINGINAFQAIRSTAGVNISISGLTIRNTTGAIQYDGGGTLSVSNCRFDGNTSEDAGGAISIATGNLIVTNSTFVNCSSKLIGGAIFGQCLS